jgi:alkylation response protein AidB-like acyl-CoA dehydrogenase
VADSVLASHPAPPLTLLSEDEQLFRATVRQFAQENIAPLVRTMDEQQHFHAELIPQLFNLGLMGVEIPIEYGGSGGTFFEAILAVEEISAVDPSVGVLIDVQNTLCINALLRWGTPEQKKVYLPRLATDTVGAYALSEASSGSDAFALQMRAEKRGDFYLLNGQKLFITNAREAGLFIVFATLDPSAGYKGITAFLVDKRVPGFTIGKKEDKLGIRASSTCEIILEDCKVPAANVLGEPGKGYKIAIETLNEGRIGIGAQMLGLAQGAWSHAARYAFERKQFGKAIGEFQAVQFDLAEMATEIEATRLMVYNCARLKDNGIGFLKEAAMCKYFASQVAERVASHAVEIFGGYGFVKDYPVEKYYRDAKIGKIYEGTSNMQLATIAKLMLGSH